MKRKYWLVALVILIFLSQIAVPVLADEYKDARKAYRDGRFDDAVRLLLMKLRYKPDHEKSQRLLPTVLNACYNHHLELASEAEKRGDWDTAFKHYDVLVEIERELNTLPPLVDKKTRTPVELPPVPVDAEKERNKALRNAAEAHYQKGLAIMREPGASDWAVQEFDAALRFVPDYKDARQMAVEAYYRDGLYFKEQRDYKQAYKNLEKCQARTPGYKDTARLLDELRDKARVRIALMPFRNQSGYAQLGDLSQLLAQEIHKQLAGRSPGLVEFFTEDYVRQQFVLYLVETGKLDSRIADMFRNTLEITEANATEVGKAIGMDYFLFGRVMRVYTPPLKEGLLESGEKTLLFVGKVSWNIYRREASAEVDASWEVRVVDTGQQLFYENSRGAALDRTEWVTSQQSESWLPREVRERNTGNRPVKKSDQLVREAVAKIGEDVASKLLSRLELE